MTTLAAVPQPGDPLARTTNQKETEMARYSPPTTIRTYDAIQADISEVTAALAHVKASGVEFWRAQAEACERLVSLWNEIVFQAVGDAKLPDWTRFAAMTTRDYYANQVRDGRCFMEPA